MEIVDKMTKAEFVQECINKIQTGRVLSLSGLFTPFWNSEKILPQIQIQEIKNIKNLVSEKDKEEAKSVFVGICVKRYDSQWTQQRPACVMAITNMRKDPLLEKIEADQLKRAIVEQLAKKYRATNDNLGMGSLATHFPEVKVEEEESKAEWVQLNGKKVSANLIEELRKEANTTSVKELKKHIIALEKANYNKEEIKKLALLLLMRYFFDRKKGIVDMNKENDEGYGRYSLIEKYEISADELSKHLRDKGFKGQQNVGKLKILVNSFSPEQWSSSETAIDTLHAIFQKSYEKEGYDLCMMILGKADLEKKYPEIKEQKEALYKIFTSAEHKKLKDTTMTRIDALLGEWEWGKAIEVANATSFGENNHFITVTYKKIYNRFRGNREHLEDMKQLLDEVEKSKIQSDKTFIENIVVAIIAFYLDYKSETKEYSIVNTYIEKYALKEETLHKILHDEEQKFLAEFEGTKRNANIAYPKEFFAYIDQFPLLSTKRKRTEKLQMFREMNRLLLTFKNALGNSFITEIQDGVKSIYGGKNIQWRLSTLNIKGDLGDREKIIIAATGEVVNGTSPEVFEKIVTDMMRSGEDEYKYILPLVKKLGKKYGIGLDNWWNRVFEKALEKEDFAYAEEILEKYKMHFGWENTKSAITEKKIMKEIKMSGIHNLDFKDVIFSPETILAFNKEIARMPINTSNLNFIIKLFTEHTNEIPETTTNEIAKRFEDLSPSAEMKYAEVDILISFYSNEHIPKIITDAVGKIIFAFLKARGIYNRYKEIYYNLVKQYEPLSDNHFSIWGILFKYLQSSKRDPIAAMNLTKEMLIFCDAIEEKEKRNTQRQVRENNKIRAEKGYYSAVLSKITKSIQVLRPLSEDLHKDANNIFSEWELEKEIENLYEFAVSHQMSPRQLTNLLQLWKEFYILTKNKEWLAMLKEKYGIDEYSTAELKRQLVAFLEDKESVGVKELTELIALFGMDILFQLYPQYTPLGMAEVKSILSQYLGQFLIQKTGYNFIAIPDSIQLWVGEIPERILTVTEKRFIHFYTKNKKQNHAVSDREICTKYIHELKKDFDIIRKDEPVFEKTLITFSAFLEQILTVVKPERMVDYLESWRDFPDFLQKLNAIEIKEKKRFLIADGMGMGKSLSAILAKEVIGTKSCLVVTPSNVVDTWRTYLSDINEPDKKKQGYFAPWKAPKVLIIESPEEIIKNHIKEYEYVVISQEKLSSDTYLLPLIAADFDNMIVDEIHKLKNVKKGKRANALLQIAEKIEEKNGHLCLLSWTPIPNKVGDIAMLLKLLYPHEYANVDNRELVQSILNGDILNLRSLLLPRMQMKKLTDHIDMPELSTSYEYLDLWKEEQFYYDAILADEEISGVEKIRKLRQLMLNPRILDISEIASSSKAQKIWADANALFKQKNKIVFFVNSFKKGVLRPTASISKEETLIAQMELDKDIEIRIIDGDDTRNRTEIQEEFNSSGKKIALFVSWSTADVGIDLSAGEHIIHINEPRTQADKDQQEARIYRYGQKKNIQSTTYIVRGSIEQWIHEYVQIKQGAILKLYYGIELSVLEKRILESDEPTTSAETSGEGEINKGLSTYFKVSAQELGKMYKSVKEAGSNSVEAFVADHGEKIAGYYKSLWPRSYQANVNRLNASIIGELIAKEKIANPSIVDLGSWPKMLYHHIADALKKNVTSIDMNPHHFTQEEQNSWVAKVGNFLSLPCKDQSVDIISSSLSFNETSRNSKKEDYERLEALIEIQRVLKKGGYAVISTIYSLEYKEKEKFKRILDILWFELCTEYSWNAVSYDKENNFHAKTLTLRKKEETTESLEDIVDLMTKQDLLDGLEMRKDKIHLNNQQSVLQKARVWNTTLQLTLNAEAEKTLNMEQSYTNLIKERESKYGSLQKIPDTLLRSYWFGRYATGTSLVLVISLPNNTWLFKYRKNLNK